MSRVDIAGIFKDFGSSVALDTLSLAVEDGEFVVLLGPSGCGKTTALRCIAGLEHPDRGSIQIGGRSVVDAEAGILVPANKRDIGMVFQSYALWPHMTIGANVAYPLKARRRASRDIRQAVGEILELVGLGAYADRYPGELSGGQQQRVALARALVADPALVLFDEPLSNLDAQLRSHLRDEIRNIHRRTRRTSIYVTHDQSEALTLADRVVLLRAGQVEQIGSPQEIFLSPRNRFVAEFVGIDNFLHGRVVSVRPGAVLVRPDGWSRDIEIETTLNLAPGAQIVAAFRSSSAIVSRERPSNGGNVIEGTLTAAHYDGERYAAHVGIGDPSIVGTLPLHAGIGLAPSGTNAVAPQTVYLSLSAAEIIVLPESDAAAIPVELAVAAE